MSWRQILGIAVIALPIVILFTGLAWAVAKWAGLMTLLFGVVAAGAIMFCTYLGIALLSGEEK